MYAERSEEFYTLVQGLKEKLNPEAVAGATHLFATRSTHREHAVRFNVFAQTVTHSITVTHEMVMDLSLRVGQAGSRGDAFDDTGNMIAELTSGIQQKLTSLHRDLEQLAILMASSRTQHSDLVVSSLRMRLMSTTKEFKDVLNTRTEALSGVHKRRSRFSYDPNEGCDAVTMMNLAESTAQPQHSSALLSQHTSNSTYRSRAAAAKQIEATVHELSTTFQDFARLMQEQESLIRRIDDDVTDALTDVDEGQTQLLKYLHNISSNRGLILRTFGIVFCFVLIFAFFVVGTRSSPENTSSSFTSSSSWRSSPEGET